MKTQSTFTQKQTLKSFSFIGVFMLVLLAFNPTYGQEKTTTSSEVATNEQTVKGIVTDEEQALEGVNVIQKRTKNGTVTNEKGEFTFPVKLKTGDILVFSYLGYEKQYVEIKDDTEFIKLVLSSELIEMIGALDTAKPYKSKRKN